MGMDRVANSMHYPIMVERMMEWACRSELQVNTPPARHVCRPDWSWVGRLHDWDFWCVLQGRGWLRIDAQRYDLEPGVCFLLHPGAETEGRHDPARPLHVFSCHFDFIDAVGGRRLAEDSPFARGGRKPGNDTLLRSLVVQALEWRAGDSVATAVAQNALKSLLLYIGSYQSQHGGSPMDSRLQRVKEAVLADLRRRWTAKSMARLAGLSPSHFNRLFKRREGRSPIEYLVHARVEEAKRLALSTDLTVAEIAEQLGYADPFFFSRQFKAVAGYPPSKIRMPRA